MQYIYLIEISFFFCNMTEDLIHFKLRQIQIEIDSILHRWNETDAKSLLDKSRNGTYINAENDAIDLHQLIADAESLREKLLMLNP